MKRKEKETKRKEKKRKTKTDRARRAEVMRNGKIRRLEATKIILAYG